jgi:hypothetical protein
MTASNQEAMMDRRWYSAFILIGLVAGCATEEAAKPVPVDLNAVTFKENLHFQTTGGTDTVLPAGQYRLVLGGADALHFQTSDGGTIAVSAQAFSHDLPVRDQFAMVIPEGEDDQHVVLLLKDGGGFDAVGSPSGLRSRGTLQIPSSILRRLNMSCSWWPNSRDEK